MNMFLVLSLFLCELTSENYSLSGNFCMILFCTPKLYLLLSLPPEGERDDANDETAAHY